MAGGFRLAHAVAYEVRLHLARGLDRLWNSPCTPDGRCHHEEALQLRRELSNVHFTSSLTSLARIALKRGDEREALAHLDEALAGAREYAQAGTILLATMLRAPFRDGGVQAALDALEEHEARADFRTKLEVYFRLWELIKDEVHLDEAHRLLQFALEHTEPEHRRSMLEKVPLHAEINVAWEQRG